MWQWLTFGMYLYNTSRFQNWWQADGYSSKAALFFSNWVTTCREVNKSFLQWLMSRRRYTAEMALATNCSMWYARNYVWHWGWGYPLILRKWLVTVSSDVCRPVAFIIQISGSIARRGGIYLLKVAGSKIQCTRIGRFMLS